MTLKEKFLSITKSDNEKNIAEFKEKYKEIFSVNANILCWEIINVLKSKLTDYKINPVYQALPQPPYTSEKKDFSENKVSVSLALNKNSKITSIFLANDMSVETLEDFEKQAFDLDTFEILRNNELPYSEEIHQGCWKAITKSLKLKIENSQSNEQ